MLPSVTRPNFALQQIQMSPDSLRQKIQNNAGYVTTHITSPLLSPTSCYRKTFEIVIGHQAWCQTHYPERLSILPEGDYSLQFAAPITSKGWTSELKSHL